jgi:hypothetical protein
MNGPDHYREAERLIDQSRHDEEPFASEDRELAQVHATLALAAATALGYESNTMMNDPIVASWWEVAS